MTEIEVARLPPLAKMPKLLYTLKGILNRGGLRCKFWIKELADMRGSTLKEAKIEFPTYEQAVQAVDRLNDYMYYIDGQSSRLNAAIVGEMRRQERSPSPHRGRSPYFDRSRSRGHSFERYSPIRDRSRSPLHRERSKLDLELELLRKKRLVIEEERRLLLEQKKLDMIREYGVSSLREVDDRERTRERRQRPKREKEPWTKSTSEKLPKFVMPCRLIMAQMKPIMKSHAKPGEKSMLEKLIINELRKRIAVTLENMSYTPTEKIVELYRNKHAESTDEELITNLLKNIRVSYLNLPKDDHDKRDAVKNSQKVDHDKQDASQNSQKVHLDKQDAGQNSPKDDLVKQETGQKINETKEIPEKTEVNPDANSTASDVKKEPVAASESNAAVKLEPAIEEGDKVVKVEIKGEVKEADIKEESNGVEAEARIEDADEDWIQDGVDWNDDESEEGKE